MTTQQLVDRYLRDLRAAAAALPATDRQEPLEDVREHIEASRADDDSEATLRQTLDRLGTRP